MKQKLLEMVQDTVQNLFMFYFNLKNQRKKKHAFLDVICKIGQNQGLWAVFFHIFSLPMNFIFFGLIAENLPLKLNAEKKGWYFEFVGPKDVRKNCP